MTLKFLSEETLMDLRTNYSDYKEHYYERDNEWFNQYFNKPGKIIKSKVDFKVPKMNKDADYTVSDRENVKILYESLKHLTPSQATHERLWTGLSHLQLRDYMFYRLEKELDNKNDRRINTGIFLRSGGLKRSLFVHFISRLWWFGYMTYDKENKNDPYWLTDFFAERDFSARCVTFFSSNFTSNKTIVKGILKALNYLEDNGVSIKRKHFIEANKYLNIIGGARILDTLSEQEVEEIVYNQLVKYFDLKINRIVNI